MDLDRFQTNPSSCSVYTEYKKEPYPSDDHQKYSELTIYRLLVFLKFVPFLQRFDKNNKITTTITTQR
ncbi:hypothetical protein GUITHDRAFT_151821 [Guillardia theta CCMP2712]|uniref:Uncharacterized protein n=1 Tax=Guillardia theta (strain CCMP2712) TaxID=905079 RepID=L1JJ73_GUITC|nr:hypothetical protein GUITHDRAFT_151821 [Guillardia theta CCMP2712]EKX48204.1 hypothetical protein GUITHDRAFT_151821 [Guillardia theta CCMP2712]|eukprot:XP_005835184.1 hypothetical protein GUITHDRAFT_151821 [Guillardia theta CCMP2712]